MGKTGSSQTRYIVKGQLLNSFKQLHTDFWPIQLESERVLLEFFLEKGNNCLDKEKLASFILSLLPLNNENLNKSELSRLLSSSAILTSYALSPYERMCNQVAMIEGWIIYISCLVAAVEKHRLEKLYWKDSLLIAITAVERSFQALFEELSARKTFVEGDPLVDQPFYRGRITWLTSFVSCYALWKFMKQEDWEYADWGMKFVQDHLEELVLWGEAAVPQFLAIYWFLRQIPAGFSADGFLINLIRQICLTNTTSKLDGLADPYHELEDVISDAYYKYFGITTKPRTNQFRGRSYTLESLVVLLVRRNWRQKTRFLWPDITHIDFAEFEPDEVWQYCLWKVEDTGRLVITHPAKPESWKKHRTQAEKLDCERLPRIFLDYPHLLLLFIIVYPHRLTPYAAKYIDHCLVKY